MPLRVLEYVVMIYKRQMRDWEKEHGSLDHLHLQPVLPIVLYTGTRTWNKLGHLWELVELGDELAERIPELEPLFLNVGQTSRQVLEQQGGPFGLLLRLVQQRRTRLPVFEQTLREVVRTLETLAEEDRQRWLELLSYIAALIYNEREEAEQEPLFEKVTDSVQNDAYRREVFDMGKTIAEGLIEKGRLEGRDVGKQFQPALPVLLRQRFQHPYHLTQRLLEHRQARPPLLHQPQQETERSALLLQHLPARLAHVQNSGSNSGVRSAISSPRSTVPRCGPACPRCACPCTGRWAAPAASASGRGYRAPSPNRASAACRSSPRIPTPATA